MKKIIKIVIKNILIFLAIFVFIVALGLIGMLITYKLPEKNVKKNVEASIGNLSEKGLGFELIKGYETTKLDTFTDAVNLNELYYSNDEKSTIQKAIMVYGYCTSNPIKDLENSIEKQNTDSAHPYSRYWHGNLLILKLLFEVFNYSQVIMLNVFIQIGLTIWLIVLMYKRDLKTFVFPFIVALLLINPFVIAMSLQFSVIFYIFIISLIILLQFKEFILYKKILPYLFLIIGMATSYFDFLTYPLVTLGMPLVFVILFYDNEKTTKNIGRIIFYSFIWGIGYIGMWASKWIVGSFLVKDNLIKVAIDSLKVRTSAEDYGRVDAIISNIKVYRDLFYKIIFGILILYYLIRTLKVIKNIKLNCIKEIVPYVIMAIMPFAWYFLAANHSYIHSFFTHRNLIIFFFSTMCAGEIFIKKLSSNNK